MYICELYEFRIHYNSCLRHNIEVAVIKKNLQIVVASNEELCFEFALLNILRKGEILQNQENKNKVLAVIFSLGPINSTLTFSGPLIS